METFDISSYKVQKKALFGHFWLSEEYTYLRTYIVRV